MGKSLEGLGIIGDFLSEVLGIASLLARTVSVWRGWLGEGDTLALSALCIRISNTKYTGFVGSNM